MTPLFQMIKPWGQRYHDLPRGLQPSDIHSLCPVLPTPLNAE